MSPGKCLSGLDTLAVTSHAHTGRYSQWWPIRGWDELLWPMRGPGDWVSGLDEFLVDWWEHSGMRCYKVRPRVLPLLSSDGCWHCLNKSIRGLHWPSLTNQLLVQVYIWDYSTGHKKQSIVLRMSLTIWLGDQCTVWSKGLLVTLKFIGLLDNGTGTSGNEEDWS